LKKTVKSKAGRERRYRKVLLRIRIRYSDSDRTFAV